MKKNTLKIEYELEASVLAIASNEHIYRLSFFINKAFPGKVSLTSHSGPKINFDTEAQEKGIQRFRAETAEGSINLVENKQEKSFIIKAYRQFNYLLILEGAFSPKQIQKFESEIKLIKGIQAVTQIPDKYTKNLKKYRLD